MNRETALSTNRSTYSYTRSRKCEHMDDCPRCHAELERLTLGEVTTIVCNRCGFADIPVDHESSPEEMETWRDAFNRFYDTKSK